MFFIFSELLQIVFTSDKQIIEKNDYRSTKRNLVNLQNTYDIFDHLNLFIQNH